MQLPKRLDPDLKKCCTHYQSCYKDKDVESLVEHKAPDVMLDIITPKELNANFKGSQKLIQRRLRLLAHKFIAKHKLDTANTVAKICTIPYVNLNDKYLRSSKASHYCSQCAVLAAATAIRRHWMIDSHYGKVYPQLDLLKNRGVLDVGASRILWQHGVYNEDLFILENVYDLLPSLRVLDLESSTLDAPLRSITNYFDGSLPKAPEWWNHTFRQLPYWDETTKPSVELLGLAKHPKEFQSWLKQQSDIAHMSVYGSPTQYQHKLSPTLWNPPKPN
jgi:hypothetical protein